MIGPAESLPAAPLLAAVEHRGGISACLGEGVDHQQSTQILSLLAAARKKGRVTVWTGDRLAVQVLGVHPVTVWGELWFTGWKAAA